MSDIFQRKVVQDVKNQPIFHSMIGQRDMHKIDSYENYIFITTGKLEQLSNWINSGDE